MTPSSTRPQSVRLQATATSPAHRHRALRLAHRLAAVMGTASIALALLASLAVPPLQAQTLTRLKIGVVNINTALNRSAAGERSKQLLISSRTQMQEELKAKEALLSQKQQDLKNNILLSDATRAQREQELRQLEQELRADLGRAQNELQDRERKATESIFLELKTVIQELGKEQAFDLVLEENASQVILYSEIKYTDLTEQVIERYNKYQGAK